MNRRNSYIFKYKDREALIRQADECASYIELKISKVLWRQAVSLLQWRFFQKVLLRYFFFRQSKRQWARYNDIHSQSLLRHSLSLFLLLLFLFLPSDGNHKSEPATIDIFYGQRHSESATIESSMSTFLKKRAWAITFTSSAYEETLIEDLKDG